MPSISITPSCPVSRVHALTIRRMSGGVKLIGATAHYVTADLDEGPIIEQAVQQVDHTFSADALTAIGRDTETTALAKAVLLHVEHRVFLDGNKTVVFR